MAVMGERDLVGGLWEGAYIRMTLLITQAASVVVSFPLLEVFKQKLNEPLLQL